MLTRIDNLLSASELDAISTATDDAEWESGTATASGQAAEAKNNLQLSPAADANRQIGKIVVEALHRNRQFVMTTLPRRVRPPLISAYHADMAYGEHVDAAIMYAPAAMRTDVALTVFLSDPASYDGGELVIKMVGGETAVKLPAGSMVCYPPQFLHRVTPVTRGVRLAAVTWVESLVRTAEQRAVLIHLSEAIDGLRRSGATEAAALNNSYNILMRMWSEP